MSLNIPPYVDLKSPSMIAIASIGASFTSRKLFGEDLGINTTNLKGPIKAFLTFIVAGQVLTYAHDWNKKDRL